MTGLQMTGFLFVRRWMVGLHAVEARIAEVCNLQAFSNDDGISVVEAMIRTIQNNKGCLSEVDGLIGDGDHGTNMNKGFTLCEERLRGTDASFREGMYVLGDILFSEIGGSMGPIYGTIFMEMAGAVKTTVRIDAPAFLTMLEAGIAGLDEIIEAKVGDKTLMDVLIPARNAFSSALCSGKNFQCALGDMVQACMSGRDATIGMVARFGRSSRLGERSRGVLDAGSASCFLLLEAMAQGIVVLLEEEDG
jgi:dihydroxyacetone kinase-like protein